MGNSRTTATGINPDTPAWIPSDAEFGVEQYLPAKSLQDVGSALVRSPIRGLGDLLKAEVDIRYLWRRKASSSKGKKVVGKCSKIGPRERHFAGNADIVIEVAADEARARKMTQWELEAVVYHELKHIGVECDEETGDITIGIVGHDVELFADEVMHYGLWRTELEVANAAFEQAGMFSDSGAIDTAYPTMFNPVDTTPGRVVWVGTEAPEATDAITVDTETGEILAETSDTKGSGSFATNLFDASFTKTAWVPKENIEHTPPRDLNVGGETIHPTGGGMDIPPDDPDWVYLAEKQRQELAAWESALKLRPVTPAEMVTDIRRLDNKLANETLSGHPLRSAQMQRLSRIRALERLDPVPPEYMAYVVGKSFGFRIEWNDESQVYTTDNDDAYASGIVEMEYADIIKQRGPSAREWDRGGSPARADVLAEA